jgi:hypothetical protein
MSDIRSIKNTREQITKRLSEEIKFPHWKDWRWQVKNSVREIHLFENLLGIRFDLQRKEELRNTVKKFPLSITPYYLSLIDINDYENDPIYKQSFPSPLELNIGRYDVYDPLAEEKTARYPVSFTAILTGSSFISAIYAQSTAGTAPVREKSETGTLFRAETNFSTDSAT